MQTNRSIYSLISVLIVSKKWTSKTDLNSLWCLLGNDFDSRQHVQVSYWIINSVWSFVQHDVLVGTEDDTKLQTNQWIFK